MNWQDNEEVMRACMIGEMAKIFITAMELEKEYEEYKKTMFEYLKKENWR